MDTTLTVERFKSRDYGCVAYLLVDATTGDAAVIDPRLDQVDEIRAAAARSQAKIIWVLDTHTHADHLSGARLLSHRTGAALAAHEASPTRMPVRRLTQDDALPLGPVVLRIMHAPGHTPDSLAVQAGNHLFTGDALLVGGAGRTDFLGGSASDLFETFQFFKLLPGSTVVHPGHDFVDQPTTTIARELETNPAFRETDREELIVQLDRPRPVPANTPAIVAFNLEQPIEATMAVPELALALTGCLPFVVLDVRTSVEFDAEHISGSVHIPLAELELRMGELRRDELHVVVCRTGLRAASAAQVLAHHGRSARVLTGGLTAWRKAGQPLIERPGPIAIDRQVQLAVGGSVLTSTLLGAFVSPWFLLISGFLGAGQVFAGASGSCGLAQVLAHAPWNRVAPAAPTTANPDDVCAAGARSIVPVK